MDIQSFINHYLQYCEVLNDSGETQESRYLETRTREGDVTDALRFRLFDPLWMLSRQWLSDNTFMAGFYPDKLAVKDGVYLMFQEADKSQRFKYSTQATDRLSSDFAVNRSDSGSLWAIEVDPAQTNNK